MATKDFFKQPIYIRVKSFNEVACDVGEYLSQLCFFKKDSVSMYCPLFDILFYKVFGFEVELKRHSRTRRHYTLKPKGSWCRFFKRGFLPYIDFIPFLKRVDKKECDGNVKKSPTSDPFPLISGPFLFLDHFRPF